MAIRRISTVVALALIASLAACGVKGPLEPPAGVQNESAPPDQSGTKPHRPFILDGLLQ